jgi:hypothetical protein
MSVSFEFHNSEIAKREECVTQLERELAIEKRRAKYHLDAGLREMQHRRSLEIDLKAAESGVETLKLELESKVATANTNNRRARHALAVLVANVLVDNSPDDTAYIAKVTEAAKRAQVVLGGGESDGVKDLERALESYGRHNEGCSAAHGPQYDCRCGWREAAANLGVTEGTTK